MTNIKNTIKIIFFASLITAMILPFSGMDMAFADKSDTEKQKIKDKQDTLIKKLLKIEAKQENTKNQKQFDRLELKKQEILAKLYNNVKDDIEINTATYSTQEISTESKKYADSKYASSKSTFNINGKHMGCNGVNETYNFKASVYAGSSWLSVQQGFPSKLTSGSGTNCVSYDWEKNLYIKFADTNPFNNKGCETNLITDPVTSYSLNCGVSLNGFWVAEIVTDYEGNKKITGYTYAAIF